MSTVTETLATHTAPLATKVTKEHRLVTLQTTSIAVGLAFLAGLAVGAGPTPEAPAAQGVAAAGEASPQPQR
jgi:hypothetical protein